MSPPLPPPRVPADAYTEAYYREACMGALAWSDGEGAQLDPMYLGYVQQAGIAPGEVLLDIGCGRGELLVAALQAGAARAVGVEYASAGVALARRTLEAARAGERAAVHQADARELPLADDEADVATLLDVVEHLAPAELDAALREARRVLRPGGRLLAHTMPNRRIYDVTYRMQRLARPSRWRTWPADPRNELEREMHVNEQSVRSLRRALRRAGFHGVDVTLGHLVYTDFVPEEGARRTYHRLAAHRPTAWLGRGDLWARALA